MTRQTWEKCAACGGKGYHREYADHRRSMCWDCSGVGQVALPDGNPGPWKIGKADERDEADDAREADGEK